MRRFGGMTRSERFAASTQQVSPLPIPLPLQNEVVDERRLLTVPWVSLFQWILNIGTRTFLTGTHADRIDEKNDPAQYRPGTWFWEQDRTVLYQVRIVDVAVVPPTSPPTFTQEPRWVYVLGTMTGKLLPPPPPSRPDQRPTDLGLYDAGFQFAATDTGQLYLWDGTAWIDITAYPYAIYGTHAERLAQDAAEMADGALWCETDRGNVLYQVQAGVWWYVSGTMFGTLIPDQRPADLGTHDAGFTFRTSVAPAREFIWSQTAWVEVTAATQDVQLAYGTADLVLTTTFGSVPGTGLTLNRAGKYLITGNFTFLHSGDTGIALRGALMANTVTQPGGAVVTSSVNGQAIAATQQWVYQAATAGHAVALQARKDGGGGSSACHGPFTSITALWISS